MKCTFDGSTPAVVVTTTPKSRDAAVEVLESGVRIDTKRTIVSG